MPTPILVMLPPSTRIPVVIPDGTPTTIQSALAGAAQAMSDASGRPIDNALVEGTGYSIFYDNQPITNLSTELGDTTDKMIVVTRKIKGN